MTGLLSGRGALACAGFAATFCALGGSEARAQFVNLAPTLPTAGTQVDDSSLREHYEQASQAAGGTEPSGPSWRITPSIDLSEAFTDNAALTTAVAGLNGKPRSDFITSITPGILINGDTSRIKVNLNYDPKLLVYAKESSFDQIAQNADGSGRITLVPDTLFLDLRAFAAVQSIVGGNAPNGLGQQNQQNLEQTYSFSAAPTFQHHFGGIGSGELGYSVGYGEYGGVTNVNGQPTTPQQQLLLQQLAGSTNSHVITQTEHATLTSGEDFGRVGVRLAGSATQFTGNGVYAGAYNNTASVDLAYAINRFVAAIARGGYDDIAYGGLPPVRINDPFWAAGAKLTLNADSSLTATYGNRYGKPNTYLNAAYSPTARLHVYANYSQALTTGLDDLQSTLSQVDVDTSGSIFDQQTGAPVAVTDNFFGIQSGVTRQSRGSIGASLIYERDSFTLSVVRQISKQISTPVGATLFSTASSGTYGSLTWAHDLSPSVKTSLFVQYGKTNQNGFTTSLGDQDSYVFSATATYVITQTLSANAMYSYSKSATISPNQSGTQNYVLVGVHKQF